MQRNTKNSSSQRESLSRGLAGSCGVASAKLLMCNAKQGHKIASPASSDNRRACAPGRERIGARTVSGGIKNQTQFAVNGAKTSREKFSHVVCSSRPHIKSNFSSSARRTKCQRERERVGEQAGGVTTPRCPRRRRQTHYLTRVKTSRFISSSFLLFSEKTSSLN